MSNSSSPPSEPGWYRNPNGGVGKEWWNGSSWGMGEYVPAPAPHSLQTPSAPAPTHSAGNTAAYASPPRSVARSLTSSERELSPYTWQIWAVSLLSLVPYLSAAYITSFSIALDPNDLSPEAQFSVVTSPVYLAAFGGYWFVFIANFFLAYADGKKLERRGVPYPLPWGLIVFGSLLYVIGRTSNVKRYIGTGLAPLWVAIAVVVVGCGVAVLITVGAIREFAPLLGSL
ncbi:hypothetical protein [Salinibacterium sp. TMP30]|uniref:hypothetical protein n=1 Tax=Salinibacterium sp. TMP30 TaxID=3138237 RepID=UPI003139C5B1